MTSAIRKYIDSRDIQAFIELLFTEKDRSPVLKEGYRHERELWDFKSEVPGSGKRHDGAWAEIARHVLAFHNASGGFLVFGINDNDFAFIGARNYCDSARFNNGIRQYVGDLFHVIFNRAYIQEDQRYLGVALVPGKRHRIVRFLADAPASKGGPRLFSRGDIAVREGDSSRTYRGPEAAKLVTDLAITRIGRGFAIDEENYRILAPEYRSFVYRRKLCDEIMVGLQDPRVAVVSLIGIGGVGKTALATWAALEAYRNDMFSFIVSITAKDRELTAKSIVPLDNLTSYEELIHTIIRVLNISELLEGNSFDEKEALVQDYIRDSNGLLYIDNLETVDDTRIINLLEKLPLGVRALVTSRIPRIRRSNYPIDVGRLEDHEVHEFIETLMIEPQFEYLSGFSASDRISYAEACNRIALPMRWIAARCKNTRHALSQARDINENSETSEELLEFSFRRIFEQLSEDERLVLKILSIYRRPLAIEAIHIASTIPFQKITDLLANLSDLSLVEVLYDDEINHDVYTLLPITSSFVYGEVRKGDDDFENTVRNRMNDWLNASDISDPVRKALARRVRQGQESSEEVLLELARDSQRKGAIVEAEQFYLEGLKRNPKSWKLHRQYAEFLRHSTTERGKALHHYKEAAQYVPKKEALRAIIYRELGILLKQSGDPNGFLESTKALEHSLELNAKDPITANVLAGNYLNSGRLAEAIKILQSFKQHSDLNSREYILKTLLQCYEKSNDIIETAYIKREIEDLNRKKSGI